MNLFTRCSHFISNSSLRIVVAVIALTVGNAATSQTQGQGFNLAPAPKSPGRTNQPGFSSQSNSLFSNSSMSRSNTNAQIASGIINAIGAGLQAANRSNQMNSQSNSSRPNTRSYQMAPNSSGSNNRLGYNTQNNLFRQPSRQYVQPSSNSYRTVPSNQYRTPQPSRQYVQPSSSYVNQPTTVYPSTSYSSGQTIRYSDGSTGVIYASSPSSTATTSPNYSSSNVIGSTVISGSPTTTPSYSSGRPVISSGRSQDLIHSTGTPIESVGSSVVVGPSHSASNQPPSLSELKATMPVVLRCPDSEIGIFAYQLIRRDSGKTYDYTMTPGQKQEFKAGSRWKIRYDQGQGQGTKTYDLAGGTTYQIRKNGDGLWGVYAE